MVRQLTLMLYLIALLLISIASAFAEEATTAAYLELKDSHTSHNLNAHARLATEPKLNWSVQSAQAHFNQSSSSVSGKNPNYGINNRAIWLHVPILNRTEITQWSVDIAFAQLERVEFYLVQNERVVAQTQQGKSLGNTMARYPSFHFELPTAQHSDLYVRIHSPNHIVLAPLQLQTSENFHRSASLDQAFWGIFYGGLTMLLLYNLMLYMATKDITLLAYLGVVTAAITFELIWSGHGQFFFDNAVSRWLSQHIKVGFILSTLCMGIFTQQFLESGKRIAKINQLIQYSFVLQFIVALLVAATLMPSNVEHAVIYLTCVVSICLYFYAGLKSFLCNYQPAKFFVVAWGLLVIAAFIAIIAKLNFIASTPFTAYCLQASAFIAAALFSVALVDKRRVYLESEVASATKDLVNNMELIEEQNVRLDIARKDAIKASHIKSQFLANISHEIRTPLNAILGFSKELLTLALPSDKQEYIQIINTSASNLLAIVNDVLDFSKIEAGKLRINQESFSPNDLLEEIVFLYARIANEKGLTFAYQRTPLPEKLIGDPVRIKQVLTNLISNAIKFTQEGHVHLIVTSKSLKNGKISIRFSIEDTGIGIDDKDKQKLFRAFSQLNEALNRSYHGTGLGLVISQQLVKLMRGQIQYDSLYGIGSQFNVSIVCKADSNKQDISTDSPWQNKSVVIYDNNPITRRATATLFNDLGAQVTSVESPGFLLTLQNAYDALIVDSVTLDTCTHPTLLRICQTFDAQDKILLHDNNPSLDRKPERKRVFNRLIEKPLALARVNSRIANTKTEDANIWQHRLASLPAINVLAVDDMKLNLKLLKTWLSDSPINLVLSNSGKDALNLCEYLDFDLILMDVQMPDMDGVETTQLIRKTQVNQGTPIIAVTAHAFKEEKERLLNSGMDDYLAKPLDLAALIDTIKRWSVGAGDNLQPIQCDLSDFDWQQAVNKANGNEALANDLFFEFVQQLDNAYSCIAEHAEVEEWEEVQHHIHRLHGASCYTGTPKLQYLLAECEKSLKLGDVMLASRYIPTIKQTIDELVKRKDNHHTGL